jgi:peptidyl-prolyl cis-trans isomerase SurA
MAPAVHLIMQIISSFTYLFRTAVALGICLLATAAQAQQKSGTELDKIIAKIDNQIVLKSEVAFGLAQLKASGEKLGPDAQCQLLESLVMNKLLLAKAETDSVTVPDEQVRNELDRRMAYFIRQVGSAEKLEEYYNKSIKQLKDDLRKQVRDQLVTQKMQGQITDKVRVTPNDIKRFFNKIPVDSLPYFSTEVEVGQIVRVAGVSKKQKDEARTKLESIRQRILAGEDFAALAKLYSEDAVSARDGGNLGFFKKRELVPEYEAASLRLEKNGISPVIESQFGFHLIQLLERRGEEYNTRHILIKPGAAEIDAAAAGIFLDSIRTRILKDSLSFAKAARDLSDDKVTKANGGLLQADESGDTRIPLDKLDPTIFFTIDTMKVGSISAPIPYRTEDGRQASRIIYLKSKTPPHRANLKDDYQKLSIAALNEEKNKALNGWFDRNKKAVFIEIDPDYSACGIMADK